jgi:hypothetical protein
MDHVIISWSQNMWRPMISILEFFERHLLTRILTVMLLLYSI